MGDEVSPPPPRRKNISSTYLLARTSLSDEEKLQVALCRRQCWIRACQLGFVGGPCAYAAVIIYEALAKQRLPRGSRAGIPLGATIFFAYVGAYVGGREGSAMMAEVLAQSRSTDVAHHADAQPLSRGC